MAESKPLNQTININLQNSKLGYDLPEDTENMDNKVTRKNCMITFAITNLRATGA